MAVTITGGTGDRINLGIVAAMNNVAAMTCMTWIKTTNYASSNNWTSEVCSNRDGNPGRHRFQVLNLDAGSQKPWRLNFSRQYATTNLAAVSGDDAFTPAVWQFIAAVDGGAGVNPEIFIGDLTTVGSFLALATQTPGAGALSDEAGSRTNFGNRPDASTANSVSGDIAWGAFYDRAFTEAELQAHQFDLRPKTNCLHMSHAGYNGITNIIDLSGNGNDGTGAGLVVADHVPLGPPFGFDAEYPFVTAAAVAATAQGVNLIGSGSLAGHGSILIGQGGRIG